MSMMKFTCPKCEQNVEAEPIGTDQVSCPGCGNSLPLPMPLLRPVHHVEVQERSTPGVAIASLVTALLGGSLCCLGIPLSLAAVICGHLGWSEIRRSPATRTGAGLCIAGLIIGYLTLAFWALMTLGFMIGVISEAAKGSGM